MVSLDKATTFGTSFIDKLCGTGIKIWRGIELDQSQVGHVSIQQSKQRSSKTELGARDDSSPNVVVLRRILTFQGEYRPRDPSRRLQRDDFRVNTFAPKTWQSRTWSLPRERQ